MLKARSAVIAAALSVVLLSGCTIGSSGAEGTPTAETTSAVPQPELTVIPSDKASAVDPTSAVSAAVKQGTIESVSMTNEDSKVVTGVVTPDKLSWKPTEALGYNKTYTIDIVTRGTDGKTSTKTSTFSTIAPSNQTKVYLTTTSTAELEDGGVYGVGIVPVAHFDEPIKDKALAEKSLVVTTDPPVQGSWYWTDSQNAHFRPEHYYTPGTKISIAANVYGKQLGEGLYGQEDSKVSFSIGDSHVSIADDNTKQVQVFENGNLVRTMPTSMGMGGSEQVGNQTISFWTQPGVYTVLNKANPVVMDSSTFGLPVNSRLGYKESINWATRISTDGIYLHELDSTVWAQGSTNTSHGCLNLNATNAQWFFNFSNPGDVVEVRNTGGSPLEIWQNGDWGVPWSDWKTGSALN